MPHKTAAVIVTYHPDRQNLTNLLWQCVDQLDLVIVVDNGSPDPIQAWLGDLSTRVELVELGDNQGIARAQNVGIERASLMDVDYVILFDQDSDPGLETMPTLINALTNLLSQNKPVACVGPRYIDQRQNNPTPFIRIEGLALVRGKCETGSDIVPVDHLIASGSVMPLHTLKTVGGMKEELFIDYVDLEWCERAKSLGFQSYGICAAKMAHSLGDEPIEFMGTAYPARSPLRHYYMFRNAVWMYRQSYVRLNWKIVDAYRLLRKYVFYTLFARPRHLHFWMMTKGMWHGLINHMGRYQ